MKKLVLFSLCATAIAQVRVSYQLESANVSTHEPIILSFSIINNSDATVMADLGLNRSQAFLISVTRPDGKPVKRHPHPDSDMEYFGRVSVEPRASFTENLLLNEWFDFSDLGNYEIRASLTTPIRTKSGRLDTNEFLGTLRVGPSDPNELSAVCEKLTQRAAGTNNYDIARQAAEGLSVIDDPIVVPYLARLMNAPAPIQPVVVSSLRRFANFQAVDALGTGLGSASVATVSLARIALQSIANTSPDARIRTAAQVFLNRQH